MASYLLSDDLDAIDERDLMELHALGMLNGGSGSRGTAGLTGAVLSGPAERLKRLSRDRDEAQSLAERLRVLSAEGWIGLGGMLVGLSSTAKEGSGNGGAPAASSSGDYDDVNAADLGGRMAAGGSRC